MIISYENCQYDLASQSSYNTAQTHALCYKQTFSLFAKSHLSVLARTCVSVRSLAGSRDELISFLNTNQRSLLQITKSIRSLMQIMTIQCARTSSMRIGCSTSARATTWPCCKKCEAMTSCSKPCSISGWAPGIFTTSHVQNVGKDSWLPLCAALHFLRRYRCFLERSRAA